MKPVALSGALFLLFVGPLVQANDEDVLREIKTVLWQQAYRTQDVALLDQLLHDDFVVIDDAGIVSTKAQELDWVRENAWNPGEFEYRIERLDVYDGQFAIVSGTGIAEAYSYSSSNTLIKDDGQWRAISSHVSGVRDANGNGSRRTAEVIVPDANRQIYESWGFAPAIKIGNVIHVSGVIVMLEGEGSYDDQYKRGFATALGKIGSILAEAGSSLDDVVTVTTYHTDIQRQVKIAAATRMAEMSLPHPAWTAVGTTGLAIPDGVTEIQVTAQVSGQD